MRRCHSLVALLVALLPLAAGCWDFRGLDQRGFVLMVGIDRREDDKFRLSLQMQTATPGQQDGQGGGGQRPYRVLTGEGDTIREAFERARADIFRELDLTFMDTIVIC